MALAGMWCASWMCSCTFFFVQCVNEQWGQTNEPETGPGDAYIYQVRKKKQKKKTMARFRRATESDFDSPFFLGKQSSSVMLEL